MSAKMPLFGSDVKQEPQNIFSDQDVDQEIRKIVNEYLICRIGRKSERSGDP
jgi:hypothetical protein